MGDRLRFAAILAMHVPGLVAGLLTARLRALIHAWTYHGPTAHPKTVVVVGGSFAGVQLVKRLAETLPTGWQAILVERNSHFNFSFNLPRYSVVPGYEQSAFIPYEVVFESAIKRGIVRLVHGDAATATASEVVLASGTSVHYDVLIVATGSAQRPPAKLLSAPHGRAAACAELRALQNRIQRARTVAVVGGGAVGVEIAADIKTFGPVVAARSPKRVYKDDAAADAAKQNEAVADKRVTLVHSRQHLLNRFGPRLHAHAAEILEEIGVEVVLGQRPMVMYASDAPDAMVGGPGTLRYTDGREEQYDCVLLCTGQTPNSTLLRDLYPGAVDAATGELRVATTLQVFDETKDKNAPLPNVFAFGDVAATGGAKMARAAYFQAEVVAANVVAGFAGKPLTSTYKPSFIEAAIKLTLGKDHGVAYLDLEGSSGSKEKSPSSVLIPTGGEHEDMDRKRAWAFLGARYREEPEE